MAYGLGPGERFRLNNFTYSSDALVNIIFKHLSNTSFDGITVSEWVCPLPATFIHERSKGVEILLKFVGGQSPPATVKAIWQRSYLL